jgi:hypothetical protein
LSAIPNCASRRRAVCSGGSEVTIILDTTRRKLPTLSGPIPASRAMKNDERSAEKSVPFNSWVATSKSVTTQNFSASHQKTRPCARR